MYKYYYYNKGPLPNHFPIWILSSLPHFGSKASPHEGKGWEFWGPIRTPSKGGGARGLGLRSWLGLDRFTAEGSFLLCLWLFPVAAAAKETAGSLSLALLRHIKASFSSSEPLGFEVELFQRLNPKGE